MGFPACPACPRGGMPLALPFFGKREHLVEGEILGYCLSPSTATVWLLAEEEDGFRASARVHPGLSLFPNKKRCTNAFLFIPFPSFPTPPTEVPFRHSSLFFFLLPCSFRLATCSMVEVGYCFLLFTLSVTSFFLPVLASGNDLHVRSCRRRHRVVMTNYYFSSFYFLCWKSSLFKKRSSFLEGSF